VGAVIGVAAVVAAWRVRSQLRAERQSSVLPVIAATEHKTGNESPQAEVFLDEDDDECSAASQSSEEGAGEMSAPEESLHECISVSERVRCSAADSQSGALHQPAEGLTESSESLVVSTPSEWSLYESDYASEEESKDSEWDASDADPRDSPASAGSGSGEEGGSEIEVSGGDQGQVVNSSNNGSSSGSSASAGDSADLP
jgi:hypothetical protein